MIFNLESQCCRWGCSSRIWIFTIRDLGSASKKLSILTQKIISKLSYDSRLFIPDPDFLSIPDPGVKKGPDPGCRIRNTVGSRIQNYVWIIPLGPGLQLGRRRFREAWAGRQRRDRHARQRREAQRLRNHSNRMRSAILPRALQVRRGVDLGQRRLLPSRHV